MPESNIDRFRKLIAELFMLDQGDLDFGIYRIMNMKRGEITRFLDNDLIPQVRLTLGELQSGNRSELQADLDNAIEQARQLGVDPEASPKVKELRERLSAEPDIAAIENEVFSSLFNFFRRYYQGGDFLSLRRYKEGVYAIPYEGEEVKLHWANADQYYIKTAENFKDYTFKLPSGLFGSDKRVHLRIVEADTERDNIQSAVGQERRFTLCEVDPLVIDRDELVIRFEYRTDATRRKQKDINTATIETILAIQDNTFQPWIVALGERMPTETTPNRTLLEKHLTDYTARNTFDYFIHKNLGGFLRRELDFFIKNEIMHLDDIESETALRVEQYLAKVKAIRRIAHKIIDMLAQLENFQKKLWQKKKFVVETNYCVTLDHVPEELYPEIAANDSQREEWVRLFAIDEIAGDIISSGYTNPITVEFLKAHPHLVLDTKFFDPRFKDKMLSSIDNLYSNMEGLLIRSENYQALNMLQRLHDSTVDCVYIDPPFNTAATQILYKNDYKHSSWLCMIGERLKSTLSLMSETAILCIAIDDFELALLERCLTETFGEGRHVSTVPVRSNPHGRAMAAGFSTNHEYALFYSKTDRSVVGRLPRDDRRNARYPENDENGAYAWINFRKTGAGSARIDRPRLFYPIFVTEDGSIRVSSMTWSDANRQWEPVDQQRNNESVVLPFDSEGSERVWNMGWERAQRETQSSLRARKVGDEWQVYRKYHANQDGALPGTWWDDAKYSATESGTRIIKDVLGEREIFSYPKSVYLVEDCLRASNCTQECNVLDFFAGSGTTGHAVINLNREDNGSRKYILVEMGEHFDTVLKPRIQKVIYSKDWREGKPVSREGSSHIFKYIRLESYEDAVNNLELSRTEAQTSLLDGNATLREDYTLRYMLDVESQGSASLLNIEKFDDPFNYTMNISTGTAGESKPTAVDLVETFNYLIGLRVEHIDHIRGFRVIQGRNPSGEKVLAIWRNTREKSSEDLDAFFQAQNYNTRDYEFDIIYVNGDNNLENLKRADETWKVRLIEEEFHRLMFDVKDV